MTGLGTGKQLADLLAVGAAGSQLAPLIHGTDLNDVQISALTLDSRTVQPGMLFFARSGVAHRGCDFILDAQAKGAAAVVVSAADWQAGFTGQDQVTVPVIQADDIDAATGALAAAFYGRPGEQLKVIGVTGTNGKTSCAHYIAQGLNALGEKTALIGTVGNGLLDDLKPATHTTPDAVSLHALLAGFVAGGATAVVMEVSSHALDQQRVAGLAFDVAAFTNLSRDHLDYHGDMQGYFAAKARLFTELNVPGQVINLDDEYGRQLKALANGRSVTTFGESADAAVMASEVVLNSHGIAAELTTPWGALSVKSPLLGRFNLSNLLLTIGVLGELSFTANQIEAAIAGIHAVPGRMQAVQNEQPLVLVDYAHTPDALEKALQAVVDYCRGDLVCVFGCGGDRDNGKRPQMAKVAESLADKLVVTSDNPRTEEPESIIDMVVAGLQQDTAFTRIADRREAIEHAVASLQQNDILLIAGKGHEDYQEVNGVRLPFDDVKVARHALNLRDTL
ncbi:UDP-N-acetylmuramoyl-L-alanyl-D-glutamate--2,6-diaminopimelate ligase [Aliamphritea hakodatensis]|uniref:UDP-N-acetylmuramoyl-L-alanyl-D-glutamate--2, 6-diaminopimelate ligase n=1 Tax=Aliamphritea hakodatensis TaxID=2895352 RepID=UPI0022FD4EF4|nr:UDP-N-acetylmuramoyl-L-alanyl-D-glutamate--2,6-diaminopimelate ligase [Aliamphritea hakodatensis]